MQDQYDLQLNQAQFTFMGPCRD